MESTEEAGRGEEEGEEEEEEEEESPKELESEEEAISITGAGEGLGFSVLLGFGKKKDFCCGEEPIRVRLNSDKMEDGSVVSRSTRSQLQRRCIFLGGCCVF